MRKLYYLSLILFASIIFSSCSKDDDDSNRSATETNRPIWVSEITEPGERENYRTEYDYKRINNKVYLSGLTCYKNNSQLLNCKFTYDSQNRLTEVQSFLPNGEMITEDNYTFDMEIFEHIGLNTTITYTDKKAIVRCEGEEDEYTLNSNGLATKFEYEDEYEHGITEFSWDNENIVQINETYDQYDTDAVLLTYDNKNSIDYITKILPFICSKNNVVSERSDDYGYTMTDNYRIEYNEYNYPTKITLDDEYESYSEYIKYIDAKDIK